MSSYNSIMNQVEPSTSSEESEADKLIQENNKLREQNLKLQKILAIAGVKFDRENEISGTSQRYVTCTPASSTFSSDIQDLNVSGGCQQVGGDDDYGSNSNNNVECSTDAVVNGNKNKRIDDDHHGGSEVLLCDTSTNVEFAPTQEEQGAESELFAELQVDTTVDIVAKSNSYEDQNLSISLPSHSNEANIKVNTQFSRPGMSYLNPDGIVDISPPLPTNENNCFPGSRAMTPVVCTNAPSSTTVTLASSNMASQAAGIFGQHPSLSMASNTPILNLQRMDPAMQLGGPLSLMGGFNNGILINQLGQQVSFLPQQQQPSNILLNSNQGLMASQTKLLSPNTNLLSQNAGLIAHQGNLLMSNGNGIFQQFAQPVSNLNLIPQAAPIFTGSQMKAAPMHGPMTLNVMPQNSSRDFLMLPNGKLVPISTQPSILPMAPSHPAMQSIITGFPNQIRLQTPQFLGNNRCSQSFSLLPNQIPILAHSDQNRLAGQNQISVNGLPVLAPGQLPQTLQIFNQLPQVSPQQNISNSSMNTPHAVMPPQNFVLPSIQPCMTAYLTPEGTIVLSLHQQNSKKVSEDAQKSSQSVNNNFLQEKKVQRRIMPKPSSTDSILNSSLGAVVSSNSTLPCHITVSSSTSDGIDGTDKGSNSVHQPMYQSSDFLRKNQQNFETSSDPFAHNHEEVSIKKKSSGRKRESGGNEKKKRPKAIVQKVENNCGDGLTSSALPGNEKSDLSDLQDIPCCMLNESLNDHFSQNLNDDDQGDINQFSDLIVMDNEVTSNPKSTLEENLLITTNCSIKDSDDNPFLSESLIESTSAFNVSSTTVSCSENVVFPTHSDSFVTQEKKTKKKRKKPNNSGLLMIEPVNKFGEIKNLEKMNEDANSVEKRENEKPFDGCLKNNLFSEVESNALSAGVTGEKFIASNELVAAGGMKQLNSSSDMGCTQIVLENPSFYPLPDRVEEGTQTIKLEKRRKNKLNKKSKNKVFAVEENKRKCDTSSETPVNVNIPDRLSFLEDQLMDVVDRVESMVAQSASNFTENKVSGKVCDMKLEMKDSHFYSDDHKNDTLEDFCGKRKNPEILNEAKPSKKLKLLSKDEEDSIKPLPSISQVGSVSIGCSSVQSELNGGSNMLANQSCGSDGMLVKSSEEYHSSPSKRSNKIKDMSKTHKSTMDSKNIKSTECSLLTTNPTVSSQCNMLCQTSLKDHGSGSARHISIASLAWSSGIAKTPMSRTCITKNSSTKTMNNDVQATVEPSALRFDSEHELVKTVDSIVEEFDQRMISQGHTLQLSEKSIESKRGEGIKGNENYEMKNVGNNFMNDLNAKLLDGKDDSLRDNRSSNWPSSVSSSCLFQMSANNSAPNMQLECHQINSDASKYGIMTKENSQDALIMMQTPIDHTANGRNKSDQESVINNNMTKNLEMESFDEANSANKFLGYPNDVKESNSSCFKSETVAISDDSEKKSQNVFVNNTQNASKHVDGNLMAYQGSRQKSQIKVEQQASKNSRQLQLQDGNVGGSSYYNVDETGKKFGYPNIFAPPLFSDPYSPSCAQFSTFPVSGGPSFEPSFMLPPCIPFDSPVASASFNYYGDTSRYSHFGHTSLANKPHSFSSIAPEYPSCSLEPKKAPANSNFSNRQTKDDTMKNKTNNRKDLFVSSDLPIDQFIVPCGSTIEKVNMSAGSDISHYGVAIMNPITSKSYASKQDAQIHNRNKSSNTFLHARNSSNNLMSPPLHHHPLIFDQKSPSFTSGFEFNSPLVNGCGIMDQSFPSNVSTSIVTNYDRECINTTNKIADDKKVNAPTSKALPNKAYDNISVTPKTMAPPTSIPPPTTSSTTQTKSTSKSSRSSKKSTSAATKTNPDNNSCMFSQTQTFQKSLTNNEVMSYFSNNFTSGLTCRTAPSSIDTSKFQGHYAPGSFSVNGNSNNLGLRTSANIGMDYMSTQILGSSGSIHSHHHHPHFGFNHFFSDMDIPNGYLKFGNPSDLETMPLHHQHKNLHQPSGTNQSSHPVLSDINPFFHPPQYSFEGSSSYFNQPGCSAGPFMSSFNIRMPRMYQNNNSF